MWTIFSSTSVPSRSSTPKPRATGAAARDRGHAGVFHGEQDALERELRNASEVVDLLRRVSLDDRPRRGAPHGSDDVEVVVEAPLGVEAADDVDLGQVGRARDDARDAR